MSARRPLSVIPSEAAESRDLREAIRGAAVAAGHLFSFERKAFLSRFHNTKYSV